MFKLRNGRKEMDEMHKDRPPLAAGSSELAGSVPPHALEETPFPDCAKQCRAVAFFGVSECDFICGFKFGKNGSQIEPNSAISGK
jgi:hypothetical protein